MKVKPIAGGKEIAQELERHKIKRLTQQDILKAALKTGDSLVVVAQQLLDKRLAEQLAAGGVAAALPYCQPENYAEVEALQHKFGGIARRTGTRLRNPQNQPDAPVAAALQKYSNPQEQKPQVVALNERELLYTAPIYIRNENCLSCHGTPGQDLTEADHALIRQKYPEDKAINYKAGELRGMWHITFDKMDLIAYLNDQPKKSRRKR
ncbi:hypothetical protein OB13_14055 [Pontibacter sp. HJ8]